MTDDLKEIELLTHDFYKAISFTNDAYPEVDDVNIMFYGQGVMINNSYADPLNYSVQTFVQELSSQVANSEVEQFVQREVYGVTELFGKIAHRTSVYEYTYADYETNGIPRGLNYIQFVKVDRNWRILSMIWSDENENHVIPCDFLKHRTIDDMK